MEAQITYQSILFALGDQVRDLSGGSNVPIRNVRVLAGSQPQYEADTLYIADAKELSGLEGQERLFLICCGEDANTGADSCHAIAVSTAYGSKAELGNAVFEAFTRLTAWVAGMQRSVILDEGVQTLLDQSENVLHNTVTVLDSSLKLLAYTQGIPPSDPPNVFLIENGYHSPETVAKFKKYNRFGEAASVNQIIVSDDRAISEFVTMKYFFKRFNEVSVYLVMLCNHRDVEPGLKDLFGVLIDCLRIYVDKGFPHLGKHLAFDSLMHDLLENRLENVEEIRQRSEAGAIPYEALFDLYKIDIVNSFLQSLAYVSVQLSRRFSDARVSYYKNSIVILNVYSKPEAIPERIKAVTEATKQIVGDALYAVGVSNPFFELREFCPAYRQADAALSTPSLDFIDAGCCTMFGKTPVYFYEDCYFWHMMGAALRSGDDLPHNRSEAMLKQLREYSLERNYDYVSFLRAYLTHERKIPEVAAAVHLHRNTVVYHLDKIRQLLGEDFDDPIARFKLLLEIYRYRYICHREK